MSSGTVLEHLLAQLFAVAGLRDFIELGGPVLILVILAGFLMWLMIFERIFYLLFGLPKDAASFGSQWQQRSEHHSWNARQIRHGMLNELQLRTSRSLMLIKTLIALAPLLGLLGTVTGMLEVFDVMSLGGAGNARALAAGISKATIPTMAGMVTALAGLYINALLTGWAKRSVAKVRYQVLVLDGVN